VPLLPHLLQTPADVLASGLLVLLLLVWLLVLLLLLLLLLARRLWRCYQLLLVLLA
jgi:hypothetical protein